MRKLVLLLAALSAAAYAGDAGVYDRLLERVKQAPKELAKDALVKGLGGEPTGVAKEPALDARDEDEKTARALELFARPAGTFSYRLVEEKKHETYVRHELSLPSAAHTTDPSDFVHGFYYEPLKKDGRGPACVVVHHLGGSFEAEEMLAAYLAQHGVASATLALPGYGKRRAEGQPKAGFLGHKDPLDDLAGMRQAVLDVRRVADLLRSRPEIDPERVGVVGISLGAIVAANSSGIDRRFARSVFVIGGGDLMKILSGDSKEAKEAMGHIRESGMSQEELQQGFALVDPLTFARRLRADDVLMLNAERDEVFPRESTLGLWRKAGYPKIKWYDSTHTGIAVHLASVMNETLDHLKAKAPEREPD